MRTSTDTIRRTSETKARTAGFFNDLLSVMSVRHTEAYSQQRFQNMPFSTLFGLSKLLEEYGIASRGIAIEGDDAVKSQALMQLPLPFVACMTNGQWVIVKDTPHNIPSVSYVSRGVVENADVTDFAASWNGTALLLKGGPDSVQPHYKHYRFTEIVTAVRNYGLWVCVVALAAFFFITNRLYASAPAALLALFNLLGLGASFMLAQKTIGVHTHFADRVCSAIQEHGCDHVLKTGGTFMGIFHWSEVGLGYFSVSLIALLVCGADILPWLALFNACCLPYTIYSVVYQKFKARAWCTLCLTVQATLWILAGLYLWSGAWNMLKTFSASSIVLLFFYIVSVLSLNKLLSTLSPQQEDA